MGYEKAAHYIFSFNKEIGKRTLRAELYYKQYDNLVKYASSVSKSYTNDGTGYAGGLDLYYHDKKTIKNGDFWVSYSYLLAERNYLNYPTTATPSFANAHSVSVVYKHWFENLHSLLGATLSYSSPRPFNNPNCPEFMGDKLRAYRSLDMNWSYLYSDNIIIHAVSYTHLTLPTIYSV